MARELPSLEPRRAGLRGALLLAAALVPLAATAALQPGCGPVTTNPDAGTGGGAGSGDAPKVTVLTPDAEPLPGQTKCEVTITTDIPVKSAVHVDTCSEVDYPTNPPSGANHWGVWASYTTYDIPVPREMYVHNEEHGAVVFLHNCQGDCPEVLALFESAKLAITGDPKCLTIPDGPTERAIITPDPLLDVPIAAATWHATYRATCIDLDSLRDFAKKHYDNSPESLCGDGKLYGDPNSGAPDCDGPTSSSSSTGTGGTGGTGGQTGTGGTGGT